MKGVEGKSLLSGAHSTPTFSIKCGNLGKRETSCSGSDERRADGESAARLSCLHKGRVGSENLPRHPVEPFKAFSDFLPGLPACRFSPSLFFLDGLFSLAGFQLALSQLGLFDFLIPFFYISSFV